jgi:hypothetical protein
MACKNTWLFMHIFMKVLFLVFISHPNEELSRMFICGISAARKVSQVLGKLTARIKMEKSKYKYGSFEYWKCNKVNCIKVNNY